jgi:hypothetical protein
MATLAMPTTDSQILCKQKLQCSQVKHILFPKITIHIAIFSGEITLYTAVFSAVNYSAVSLNYSADSPILINKSYSAVI